MPGHAISRVWVLVAALVVWAATAPELPASTARTRPQVVLVTSDCTSTNFLCPAFVHALRQMDVRGQIISPDDREDPVGTLSLLAARRPALVIVDFAHTEALATVARRYPRSHFALFDAPLSSMPGLPRNVQAVVQLPGGAAYLAGWLAARLEQRRAGKDVIGVVGGAPIPSVQDFIVAYRAGARRADPSITVLAGYSNDFIDVNKCDAIARVQIVKGAGSVFDVAGQCGLGALAAARRAGIWGIGVDTDQSFLGPFILTSVEKRYDAGLRGLLEQVRTGRLRSSGTTELGLKNGGAALGPISPKVPAAIRAGLERIRRLIVTGQIDVPRVSRP
jgi:basic membrane protein A